MRTSTAGFQMIELTDNYMFNFVSSALQTTALSRAYVGFVMALCRQRTWVGGVGGLWVLGGAAGRRRR